MKTKIDEIVEEICKAEGLTTIEVYKKYPDLAKIKHEQELRERSQNLKTESGKKLLKG